MDEEPVVLSPAPVDPRSALLRAAQELSERLLALPLGVVGPSHPRRLARALSLDIVDLIGAAILRAPGDVGPA